MAHVFVSYAHDDFEFADILRDELKTAGFDVWIDEERLTAGENWREEIDDAIHNCFALVLVLTPTALASKYVQHEWSFAWGAGKKIIPVLRKAVKKEMMHPRFGDSYQHLNFTTRNRDWDKLFERLKQIEKGKGSQSTASFSTNGPLFAELRNSDKTAREFAVKTLGKEGNYEAVEPLLNMLAKDKDWGVRARAAESLGIIGDMEAVSGLIDALRDGSGIVRREAAEALGELRAQSAIPALRKCLYDVEDLVRRYAAEALGILQDSDSVQTIIDVILEDENPHVRGIGARALGNIGDPRAVPHLIDHLQDNEEVYPHELVCQTAAGALIRIGTPEALNAVHEWRKHRSAKF